MNSVWYLLADFTQSDEPAGDLEMQQVTAVARDLNLSPTDAERIRSSVAAAVSKAARDSAGEPVTIRIYVSGPDRTYQGQAHGWGFFLVGRHVDETIGDGESPALVELFLYAEEDR